MTTTALPLLRSLTLLAALGSTATGCLGAESADDEAADHTEAAVDAGKTYHLVSVHSGLALDVTDKSMANGAKIQQWAYGHGSNQQWKLTSAGNGTYTLVGAGSGKCLDVAEKSNADGARLQLWSCHGGSNQQWKLQSVGGGAYEIVGAGSGKCLDVNGVSNKNGAAVQQWGCWGGDNQRWRFEEDAPAGGGTPATGKIEYAPYFETWDWDGSSPFGSLAQLQSKAGLEGVTLAFVLAGGGCHTTRDAQDHLGDINAFRSAGGKVKASFGGASGNYLESKCGSAGALAGAMAAFVDETGITDLDFDIEQDANMKTPMNQKRGQALKQLQDQKNIKVSFTLPASPSGLESRGIDVVKQAVGAGVRISHVNLMVMDYGPSDTGSMSGYAKSALSGAHAQLLGLVPGLDDAGAWRMLGATPMIGQNDVPGEVFTLGDAQALLAFAQQKGIGLISFWSIQRDRPGSDYNEASTVNGKNFQFNDIFKVVQ